MSSRPTTVITSLFSSSALFPLSEAGGVSYPVQNKPGSLRPYSAGLAVPMPTTGRHNTSSTRPATSIATQRSDDGRVVPDSTSDVGQDS